MSLNPIRTKRSNIACLRRTSIGLARAWLPSRRSTELHNGARSIERSIQVREPGSSIGCGSWRMYLWIGIADGRCGFHQGCWADRSGKADPAIVVDPLWVARSEEHTSELQS